MLHTETEALETVAADTDDFLVWVLVLSELAAFGILIAAFLLAAVRDPESFAIARIHLSPGLATANTLLLLTSGWQAAMAARRGATKRQQQRALVLAALLGFVFTAIKLVEFNSEMHLDVQDQLAVFYWIRLASGIFVLISATKKGAGAS